MSPMASRIEFPATWITPNKFELTLVQSADPLMGSEMSVRVRIPHGCSIMVDAGVRLLSYLNVLAALSR